MAEDVASPEYVDRLVASLVKLRIAIDALATAVDACTLKCEHLSSRPYYWIGGGSIDVGYDPVEKTGK